MNSVKLLSHTSRGILQDMFDAEKASNYEDAEIVCEGKECWLGLRRVSRRAVDALLRDCLISEQSERESLSRYTINDCGRIALTDESIIIRVREAIATNTSLDVLYKKTPSDDIS